MNSAGRLTGKIALVSGAAPLMRPGAIHTPILDKVMAQVEDPKALYAGWVAGHPVGRLGKPEEIAAYLASDESAFATGAEFVLDGSSSLQTFACPHRSN